MQVNIPLLLWQENKYANIIIIRSAAVGGIDLPAPWCSYSWNCKVSVTFENHVPTNSTWTACKTFIGTSLKCG